MKTLKILLICIMIFLAIAVASAYTLPDINPVISFVSNTQDADTVAVLTAVAVDSLTNAGISKIDIYQDSNLIESKNCNGAKTCTFTKTIIESNSASHSFYAKATDLGGNAVDSQTISVTFKGVVSVVNLPPTLDKINGKQVAENNLLQFTVNGNDPNNDILTYSASGLPANATFVDKTFSWTPAAGTAGSYQVTFKVSDNQYEYSETITIAVTAAGTNNPPEISDSVISVKVLNASTNTYTWNYPISGPLGQLTVTRSRELTFAANVSDKDNDKINYHWYLNGPLAGMASTFSHSFTDAGSYNITLVVDDNKTTSSATWLVDIKDENLYGQVIDMDTGQPVSGVNISLYDVSSYDPVNGAGDYNSLQPKAVPDTVSDANGNYNLYLPVSGPLASVYNMVVQGSDEKDFEIYVNSSVKKNHNIELDEDRVSTTFNAEGHILHSGQYENGNKYVCGEQVEFTMFGINHGSSPETITFLVQDHTANGNPNAPIIYQANISNPYESLTIDAGNNTHKNFAFTMPCGYNLGKYDIHVLWQDSKWHKIGNFFIIQDNTPPVVSVKSAPNTYTNQNATIQYLAADVPEPGSIRELMVRIAQGVDARTLSIYLDKDISVDSDGDGNSANDRDYEVSNYTQDPFLSADVSYNKSGHYTARLFALDASNLSGSEDFNITVYATESEANTIAIPIYNLFNINTFLNFNYPVTITSSPPVTLNADRYEPTLWKVGDEYITPGDGFNGLNGVNKTEVDAVTRMIYENTGAERLKPINSMTTYEYNYTLISYLYFLNCVNGNLEGGSSCPACNAQNFAPEIWQYSPQTNPSVNLTASYSFNINTVDPNNDVYNISWYVDNNLITNTADTNYTYVNGGSALTFVANSSLIGAHNIRATALDYSGTNISITNGPRNSAEWTLTVTA